MPVQCAGLREPKQKSCLTSSGNGNSLSWLFGYKILFIEHVAPSSPGFMYVAQRLSEAQALHPVPARGCALSAISTSPGSLSGASAEDVCISNRFPGKPLHLQKCFYLHFRPMFFRLKDQTRRIILPMMREAGTLSTDRPTQAAFLQAVQNTRQSCPPWVCQAQPCINMVSAASASTSLPIPGKRQESEYLNRLE